MKYFTHLIILLLLASFALAQDAGTVKWTFDTGSEIFGAPAIGSDGTIYVTSNDHYLYAINSDGTLKWKFDAGYGIKASPVIGSDGTIYIATVGLGYLIAVSPDGTQKWISDRADGWIEDTPALMGDGTLVFGTTNQNFYGYNPDGTNKWTITLNWNEYSSPAVAADGTIYIGLNSNGLYARNPDGSAKWNFSAAGSVQSSPAIGGDGTIYVGSSSGNLYAINPDGTEKWHFETGGTIYASPVIGEDGTVYVGSSDMKFYAINPDGTEKWHFTTLGGFMHADIAAVGADGLIYVTGYDTTMGFAKYLYAFNSDGSLNWVYTESDVIQGGIAISDDGTLYVGSYGGTLHAIHSTSTGLANSPWPRFHHDNKGTGNVQTATAIRPVEAPLPEGFTVSQAYPNPFNPATRIRFSLNKASRVQVTVYNAAGQLVANLLDAQKAAGSYELSWNAAALGSGVYFIQVQTNGKVATRKALLVK